MIKRKKKQTGRCESPGMDRALEEEDVSMSGMTEDDNGWDEDSVVMDNSGSDNNEDSLTFGWVFVRFRGGEEEDDSHGAMESSSKDIERWETGWISRSMDMEAYGE